jgi:acylphosphatase
MVQAHIYYAGYVQGVGFRYTATQLARDLKLTGWVRNLSDGRVEVLVQGSKDQVEKFCDCMDHHFETNIQNKQIDFQSTQDSVQGFNIIH